MKKVRFVEFVKEFADYKERKGLSRELTEAEKKSLRREYRNLLKEDEMGEAVPASVEQQPVADAVAAESAPEGQVDITTQVSQLYDAIKALAVTVGIEQSEVPAPVTDGQPVQAEQGQILENTKTSTEKTEMTENKEARIEAAKKRLAEAKAAAKEPDFLNMPISDKEIKEGSKGAASDGVVKSGKTVMANNKNIALSESEESDDESDQLLEEALAEKLDFAKLLKDGFFG